MLNRTLAGLLVLICMSGNAFGSDLPAHEHHGPNHFSVLLAQTKVEGEHTEPTIGIDYEYRVNDLLGLGVVVEHAAGGLDAWTYLAVADIHITNEFIIQVGPGFEHSPKHDVAVGRLGMLYEFTWGEYTLSPQLHYDYHEGGDENAIVFGIALGIAF